MLLIVGLKLNGSVASNNEGSQLAEGLELLVEDVELENTDNAVLGVDALGDDALSDDSFGDDALNEELNEECSDYIMLDTFTDKLDTKEEVEVDTEEESEVDIE
jgi:hypothetical protein